MPIWLQRLGQFHRFLAHRALYPILLSTLLACGLFAGRVYLSDTLIAIRLTNPWDHPGTIGVTLVLAAFLLVCYLTFNAIPSHEQV